MVLMSRVIAKIQQLLVCREGKPKSGIVHARSGVDFTSGNEGRVEEDRRYQAVCGGEDDGFARCHLGSSLIPLVKIVTIERAEEIAHQKADKISVGEVEDKSLRR